MRLLKIRRSKIFWISVLKRMLRRPLDTILRRTIRRSKKVCGLKNGYGNLLFVEWPENMGLWILVQCWLKSVIRHPGVGGCSHSLDYFFNFHNRGAVSATLPRTHVKVRVKALVRENCREQDNHFRLPDSGWKRFQESL